MLRGGTSMQIEGDGSGNGDDVLELTEPLFDEPPVLAVDERRMQVRAYNYWVSLLNGRAYPSVADLDPSSLDDFGPHSILLDFTADREQPAIRFIGRALRAECGLERHDITLSEVPTRSLISRLTDHFFQIIANRAPVGFEAEFVSQRGNNTLYRGILMPLSSDGEVIDFIYGVINWKELAEADLEAQLVFEVAEARASAPEPADVLDLDTPLPPEAETDTVAWTLAPREETDESALFADPLIASPTVADRLAQARLTAETVKSADMRSRAALYRALSDAYDFHLAAAADPEGYAEILNDVGLTPQARAPMTPIVKLVFGLDYDKTRLTEFAAALSFAARQRLPQGAFFELIDRAEGGLKGLVLAERAARRAEDPQPASDRAAVARARLRGARAVAHVALPTDGGDEFVLLVARRESNGTLAIVEAVPHADSLVDGALRKLGAPSCSRMGEAA